ncbi:MAG: AbrB/MazE/SpoVT family DNA-binding domain-containing protein [Candidatus Nanohalobium sp.]
MSNTFRARKRHGADSLDLTIPAEMVREMNISDGDVFKLEVEDGEDLKLTYERVYSSEE